MWRYFKTCLLTAGLLSLSSTQADELDCVRAGVPFVHFRLGVYELSETLSIPSGVTIVCDDGAVFQAKAGCFKGVTDALIEIKGSNVTIIGCAFSMRKAEYVPPEWPQSEYRHCISLVGASNVRLQDVRVADSGGDGVGIFPLVTGLFTEDRKPCTNITIDRLTATGNYRNGLAIISCVGCTIRDSVFENTRGTAPCAGFILEPDHGGDRAADILVERCTARNNAGSAYFVQMKKQNQNSQPISVMFKDCVGLEIPHGHHLVRVDNFNKNEIPVKPTGKICWNDSCWP